MKQARLREILDCVRNARIGVTGDWCIDAYWVIHTCEQQYSIESGKASYCIKSQKYALGGAGNLSCNLAALGAGVVAIAVLGDDIFGREMRRLMNCTGIDCSHVVTQHHGWQTPVYAKPLFNGIEQERIDFGRHNVLFGSTEDLICKKLREQIGGLNAMLVNQQIEPVGISDGNGQVLACEGMLSDDYVRLLNSLSIRHRDKLFAVNSRHQTGRFRGFVGQVNHEEAMRLCNYTVRQGVSLEELSTCAHKVYERQGCPIVISCGEHGLVAYDGTDFIDMPAISVRGELDTTGAGDTTFAALTASLCAGASLREALEIASLASAVTIQKLQQTGTATAEEIITLAQEIQDRKTTVRPPA